MAPRPIPRALILLLLGGCTVQATVYSTGLEYAPVSTVEVYEHPELATVLVVEWTQDLDVDEAWLEVETLDGVHTTPPVEAPAGRHSQVILGAPPGRPVEFTIHNLLDEVDLESEDYWSAMTGASPEDLPTPELVYWDPQLASDEPFVLLSVDTTTGGWSEGPFYVYILNRFAEVVWYREVPDDLATLYPRPSADGTHLAWEQSSLWSRGDDGARSTFQRLTLGLGQSQRDYVPFMTSAWEEGEEGELYLDSLMEGSSRTLDRLTPAGERDTVWNASQGLGLSWGTTAAGMRASPDRDTVLWTLDQHDSVAEVDLGTGELLHLWGELSDQWSFDPPEARFRSPGYAGYTDDGHLLLTTREGEYGYRAREYVVDEASHTLRLLWEFGEETYGDFASFGGGATRLPGGNTLVDYGDAGLVQEVGPSGEVVWELDWSRSRLVGHPVLLDDLYALDQGW